MKTLGFLVVLALASGCSRESNQRQSVVVDEVPKYLGTDLNVATPEGVAAGQGHFKVVEAFTVHRLDLYLRASSTVERGVLAMNANLPFALSDLQRENDGVKLTFNSELTYKALLSGAKPQLAWTLRGTTADAPEEGTTSVEPAGTLPEQPGQRPESGDVFLDVGGPAIVAKAELFVDKTQKISGYLTLVPRSALDFAEGTVDLGKVYQVELRGRTEVGCVQESEFAAVNVGLENTLCSTYFSDFVGPLNQ